ncbi:Tau-tubulin kinase 2 [Phlyctochytrium bullatum]|nr:Tau-tubulin kinase 2 [Phlyctochytrium bullatum]
MLPAWKTRTPRQPTTPPTPTSPPLPPSTPLLPPTTTTTPQQAPALASFFHRNFATALAGIAGAAGAVEDVHAGEMQAQNREPAPAVPSLRNVVIKGRWKIIETVGKGAFGEVYTALDFQTSETVAIKVESPACKKPVLKLEIAVLRKLQDTPYFARHIAAGRFTWPSPPSDAHPLTPPASGSPSSPHQAAELPVYSYMVMELLGPNLSELRRKAPHGRFSVATTMILARQMLRSIQALHEIGILHRDVKPGNFCMELTTPTPTRRARCILIDFGLSRRYRTPTGAVRDARARVGFRGTARYASIAAHLGAELGRVDDLWSLFYLILEFITGSLPWKGKEKDRISELKMQARGDPRRVVELCGGSAALVRFHDHLCGLGYADRPDYEGLDGLLGAMLREACGGSEGEGVVYDWERGDADTVGETTVTEDVEAMHHAQLHAERKMATVGRGVGRRMPPMSEEDLMDDPLLPDDDLLSPHHRLGSPAAHHPPSDSAHLAHLGSSLLRHPTTSLAPPLSPRPGPGANMDRRASLSTTSLAMGPASPPVSAGVLRGHMPLSPGGRVFGEAREEVGGVEMGEERDGEVPRGVPVLRSPPLVARGLAREEGQQPILPTMLTLIPHNDSPPTEPPKTKASFRARRYMKFSNSNFNSN